MGEDQGGLSRRHFLQVSGAAAAGAGLNLTFFPAPSQAGADLGAARRTHSICPYCAVGCGLVIFTDRVSGRLLAIEGDPEHPISQGALCAKGAALPQLALNPDRLTKVLYRRPGGEAWEEKPYDWALDRIAERIKETRDETFRIHDDQGRTINRTEGLAHLGSAALDNEECWFLQAVLRALGLVYIEHQARI